MKLPIAALACLTALAGCTTAAPELKPIPGSITYNGQPRTGYEKSPIGSAVRHSFRTEFGYRIYEVYILQPDRTLKLVSRHEGNDFATE